MIFHIIQWDINSNIIGKTKTVNTGIVAFRNIKKLRSRLVYTFPIHCLFRCGV